MIHKILVTLILALSSILSFAQRTRHYNYYIKPVIVYSQKFFLPHFIPKKTLHFNNNLFIFGNLLNDGEDQPAVFIKYPEPTFKILTDSANYVLSDATVSDSAIYITGYKKTNFNSQGWIAKVDELGNMVWDKTLEFNYSNKLCCVKTSDTALIVAGTFQDQDQTINLQLLSLSPRGQILNGKSYAIGKEYTVTQLLSADSLIVVTGYKLENERFATLNVYDKNFNIVTSKTFFSYPGSKFSSITPTKAGYLVVGSNNNKPWIVALNQNFSIKNTQTLTTKYSSEILRQILPFNRDFIISGLAIDTSQSILTRIFCISTDGYEQWQLPYLNGLQLLNLNKSYFYSIFSDGNYLTIQKYRTKVNALWHKAFRNCGSGTPVDIVPSYYGTVVLTQNLDTAEVWLFDKNSNIKKHFSITNFKVFGAQTLGQNIFILTKNLKDNQFYIIKKSTNSNSQTQTKINFIKSVPIRFYKDSKANFYFLVKNTDTLTIVKTDKHFKNILSTQLPVSRHRLFLDKRFLYLVKSSNDDTDSLTNLQIKQYSLNGNLLNATTLQLPIDSSKILYLTYHLNSYYIVKSSQTDTKILKFNGKNGQTLWTVSLPKKTLYSTIHNSKLITISPTNDGIQLNYFSIYNGKHFKSITYNDLDSRKLKIISNQFLYILSTTNATEPQSYILLKLY